MKQKHKRSENIKFYHLRYHDYFVDEAGFVSHQLSPRGGVTIAYEPVDRVVNVGIAICSLRDHYNRSIGRSIAASRMDRLLFNLDPGMNPIQAKTEVMQEILKWFLNDDKAVDHDKVVSFIRDEQEIEASCRRDY